MKRLAFCAAALSLLLAGCATPQRSAPPEEQAWTGRLALNVEGRQAQSFSGGFELRGAPAAGELRLFSPLGGVVAVMAWQPGSATLRTGDGSREFGSLEALAEEATGAPLPVASLFDWLRGVATPVAGWTVDVSRVADGRLHAQRTQPPPLIDLRLVFEP